MERTCTIWRRESSAPCFTSCRPTSSHCRSYAWSLLTGLTVALMSGCFSLVSLSLLCLAVPLWSHCRSYVWRFLCGLTVALISGCSSLVLLSLLCLAVTHWSYCRSYVWLFLTGLTVIPLSACSSLVPQSSRDLTVHPLLVPP